MSKKHFLESISFFRGISLIVSVLVMSVIISFAVLAWTGPSANPPGNNADKPLNVSSTAQSKVGGLILNTGGAAIGLIVNDGDVGIGTTTPSQMLTVAGTIESTSGGIKFPDGSVQAKASLKVFKNDGTTLVGTFVGFNPTAASISCSSWVVLNQLGTLNTLTSDDCATPSSADFRYELDNCNGAIDGLPHGWGISGTDVAYCSGDLIANREHRSWRNAAGGCINVGGSATWSIGSYDCVRGDVPCGGGPCVIKH